MKIDSNSFAGACYEMNSINELETAINNGADLSDMNEWGLTAEEWEGQIKSALSAKIQDLNDL